MNSPTPFPTRFSVFALGRRRGLFIGALVYAIAALVDYLTPPELTVFPLYLFSVLIVSWNCGRDLGFALAITCLVTLVALSFLESAQPVGPVFFAFINLNRATVLSVVVILTSQLRRLYDREAITARIDHLTGVRNRKGFEETLEKEIARHQRHQGASSFCVAYLDCDDFKMINDRYGHAEGDRVLIAIANIASASLRLSDTVGRLGGDEFAVLLPETDESEAVQALSKLRDALERNPGHQRFALTFSMGVASFVDSPGSVQSAMQFADALMYRAKRKGKNQLVVEKFDSRVPPEGSILELSRRQGA
jgi:diguanylate cyclase (GGDEF)-like protein